MVKKVYHRCYLNNLYHHLSLTGVKGRLQTRVYGKDDEKKYQTEVVAEKVTFLSSKKHEEAE